MQASECMYSLTDAVWSNSFKTEKALQVASQTLNTLKAIEVRMHMIVGMSCT